MLRRADIPFRQDPAGRLLPWLVAALVYVGVLALVGGVRLGETTAAWRGGLKGSVTVELPAAADPAGGAPARGDDVAAALAVLNSEPAVAAAEPLEPADVGAMVEPWIGDPALLADIPLPRLIDVSLRPGMPIDLARLGERLRAAVPGAAVDDHGVRVAPLLATLDGVAVVVTVVAVLAGAALVLTVVMATRGALAAHDETIEVLHRIGAPDGDIANRYATRAFRLALAGATGGVVLAAVTIGGLALAGRAATLPALAPVSPALWWTLAATPPAVAALAMVTARFTVLHRLKAAF